MLFGKKLSVCSKKFLLSNNVTYGDNKNVYISPYASSPDDDNTISISLNTFLYHALLQSNITQGKYKVTALHNVNFRPIMQET